MLLDILSVLVVQGGAVCLPTPPSWFSGPTGVFNQRFETLFPCAGTLDCTVCFTPPLFLPVYLCLNMGPQGLLAATWPAPFHNPPPCWVCQLPPAASPLHPGCLSPPLLPVWMNISSLSPWLSDFHTVRFSVSSGCFLFLIVVVLLLVVQGGTVCLPTPPSWPEV